MLEGDKEKIKELAVSSMRLGFNMGVVAMRLKMMELIVPYLDEEILDSDLLTKRDALRLPLEAMSEFNADAEFERMKLTIDGDTMQKIFGDS